MKCQPGCGACCIVVSISSPIPGMPDGKPAGVRCAQLTADNRCAIFGEASRPMVCACLRPSAEMCGGTVGEVYERLAEMERLTRTGAGGQGRTSHVALCITLQAEPA